MNADVLRARVEEHLSTGNPLAAFEALLAHERALGHDRDFSLLFLETLRHSPGRASLLAEAEQVLTAFPTDPQIVIAANAALIAAGERRPMDEPPLTRSGPAHRAVEAAKTCLAALDEETARDPEIAGYLYINLANALRLCGPDRDAEALEAFDEALSLDGSKGEWFFDLGLLHKWRGRFAAGLDANLKARARLGETRGVQWNLAICATGAGEGDLAAGVWKALGMPAEVHPDTQMPFVDGLPPMQVRVLSRGPGMGPPSDVPDRAVGFELVWVTPLSPCHGVVSSPTFRDAPIDMGDLVLWDGAPVGVAQGADGKPVPRFPLLEILKRGDERRLRFVALVESPRGVERLEDALPEGALLFVQRERIESARPVVGSALTLEKQREQAPIDDHRLYGKIIVPASLDLAAVRDAVEAASGREAGLAVAIPELYEGLGDAKRAGREHQAYRGLEKRAEKRYGGRRSR